MVTRAARALVWPVSAKYTRINGKDERAACFLSAFAALREEKQSRKAAKALRRLRLTPPAERGFDDGGGGEQGFLLEGAADELDAEG